jgi:hypothetical protein
VSFRQLKTSFIEILIPIILIILGLALANIQFIKDPPAVELTINDFKTPNVLNYGAMQGVDVGV